MKNKMGFYYGYEYYKKLVNQMINQGSFYTKETLRTLFLQVRKEQGGNGTYLSTSAYYNILNTLKAAVEFDGVSRWSKKTTTVKNARGSEKKVTTFKLLAGNQNRNEVLKIMQDFFNRKSEVISERQDKKLQALKDELGVKEEKEVEQPKEKKAEREFGLHTGYRHFLVTRLKTLYTDDYRQQEEYVSRGLKVPENIREKIYKDRKELELTYPEEDKPELIDLVNWLKVALVAKHLTCNGDRVSTYLLKRKGYTFPKGELKKGLSRFEKYDLDIDVELPNGKNIRSIKFKNIDKALSIIKDSITLLYGLEGERLETLVTQCTPPEKDWFTVKAQKAADNSREKKQQKEESTKKKVTKRVMNLDAEQKNFIIRLVALMIIKQDPTPVTISWVTDIVKNNSFYTVNADENSVKNVLDDSHIFEFSADRIILKQGITEKTVNTRYTTENDGELMFATLLDFNPETWMKNVKKIDNLKGDTSIYKITYQKSSIKNMVKMSEWLSKLKAGYETVLDQEDLIRNLKDLGKKYGMSSIFSTEIEKNDITLYNTL